MKRHKAIEATLERARHYGAMARDALGLFRDSAPKKAHARRRDVLHRPRALIARRVR